MVDVADVWGERNVWYLGRSVRNALKRVTITGRLCGTKVQRIKPSLEEIKAYARGWLNYYGIASMRNNIDDINGWSYHRIRMCIWKQVEETENEAAESNENGSAKGLGMEGGNEQAGILVHNTYSCRKIWQ